VSIHETADATEAAAWWANELRLASSSFQRPTIKRHRPLTNRRNAGDDYHGCLVVDVRRSREVYWRAEGLMAAIGVVAGD
jgi:hypothetical protein